MAPKKPELIEKPATVSSSSEEEENESGSSEEESGEDVESSGEDVESSGEEESSDEEGGNQTKPVHASVDAKKPEADSEDESGSDSDSDSGGQEKPIPTNVVPLKTTKSAKRSLNQADDVVEVEAKKKKRMKTSAVEHAKKKPATSAEESQKASGDKTKKQLFQRIFSEEDELALLQGILDFTETKGDPTEHVDVYCDSLKKLINVDANKGQLLTKIRRLKKRFENMVKKNITNGKSEEENAFSKPYDQTFFELSKQIWGSNGALASKSRKKTGKKPKEIKFPNSSKKKEADTDVDECILLSGSEFASFFMAENAASMGLNEAGVSKLWEKVCDASKKREIEERLKKIKRAQALQSLTRIELVKDVAEIMLKDNA